MEKISYITQRRRDNNKPIVKKRPVDVAFVAITAFVLFGPTVLLCLVLGQAWPLLMMVGSDVLGATLGVAKFNRPPRAVVSCVPPCVASNASTSHTVIQEKKAA